MTATIIDGKSLSQSIRDDIKKQIADRVARGLNPPGLATILVGDDPASQTYVRNKHRACDDVGIRNISHELPEDTSQEELDALIKKLNDDPEVTGILLQLPLPKHLDEESLLAAIKLTKDVDGFNPINIGRIALRGLAPVFVPCTPAGIMKMLKEYQAPIQGANAVVIGRSNIVGMPVSLLLTKENATVTICHSKTRDLTSITRNADILIAAIGKPEFVSADMVKPGAYVIDVGINSVDDPSRKSGYRLVGDVAFDEVAKVAGAITPVPGGVGPMTIAMLLKNTMRALELAEK
ncbi:MAG: bifunctional methylenetetrahydrofolate dehydrogenase/methenyltetrahydrofolate cyclohydrolase FolD [Chloroflexi bacterium]|jgi:methylenetetrahydrofolate dehydrogenase (NADP+)/methenyltetrahydrofolate cyclohydrolase|nr:bifunctional methylenetetrahydrofolate dehydrogenase/methenyltetrahydrofolate cyclohydrolase FolD [Chloroflexota bacterium]